MSQPELVPDSYTHCASAGMAADPGVWRLESPEQIAGCAPPRFLHAERSSMSATLECEADVTFENEATGLLVLVCRVLGSDAGQGVDAAVA